MKIQDLWKQDPRLQGRAPGFRWGQDRDEIGTRQPKDRDKSDKEKTGTRQDKENTRQR